MAEAAAYFDIDGTLVGINLIPPTIHYILHQASPLDGLRRFGGMLLGTPALIAAEFQDRRLFNEELFSHFRGISEDRMIALSREVFEDIVKPNILPGAKELIDQCKRAGLRVVLITGSLEWTMEPLRRHLGADTLIANRLELKDGCSTGKLKRPVVAGPGKATLIVEDARANGHDLLKCHAYSDSYSDVPMLSVVGHPSCIRPDARLRKLAEAYHWATVDISRRTR